jgi:hypothetical protein
MIPSPKIGVFFGLWVYRFESVPFQTLREGDTVLFTMLRNKIPEKTDRTQFARGEGAAFLWA